MNTGKPWLDNAYTIKVCQCCMLTHANGECCASDEHGGDGCEPLGKLAVDDGLAAGMSTDEHAEDCTEADRDSGNCNCETDSFSWSDCEGCGSGLGGERHAMTVFPGERKARV